jgi:hypothetical protein
MLFGRRGGGSRADARPQQSGVLAAQQFNGVCQPTGWFRWAACASLRANARRVVFVLGGSRVLRPVASQWPEETTWRLSPNDAAENCSPCKWPTYKPGRLFDSRFAVRDRHAQARRRARGAMANRAAAAFAANPSVPFRAPAHGQKQGAARFDSWQFCRLVLELYDGHAHPQHWD